MAQSFTGKALLLSLALAVPAVLFVHLRTANGFDRAASLAWGALVVLISCLVARRLAGRTRRLAEFADRLMDTLSLIHI